MNLLLLLVLAPTWVIVLAQSVSVPTVALKSGILTGTTSTGIDSFLGFPYAQPPLGALRYAAPVPLAASSRNVAATKYGLSCLQPPSTLDAITLADVSEDCLSMNVFRPAGTNATARLPVMVWIYGGSFTNGGSKSYNPAALILQSVSLGEPVIYASFNYRLNSFGFLASTEVEDAVKNGTATLNAGLHDMQAALVFVQENIASFGGDPQKVTVFGESAGAIGIGSLLVADGGKAVQRLNLFRAAIMESGAPSGVAVPPTSFVQSRYDTLAQKVGCASALKEGTSLECLRKASSAALLNATTDLINQPGPAAFPRSRDEYFHTETPGSAVLGGRVANVPIITGNNLDEGTFFSPTTSNSDADTASDIPSQLFALDSTLLTSKLVPAVMKLYPDDPTVGSPYNTGTNRFYGSKNQYKRLSSLVGDNVFQAGRRLLLESLTGRDANAPVYSYLFTATTPFALPALGVYHSSEIQFGQCSHNAIATGNALNPPPLEVYGGYATLNATSAQGKISLYMMSVWIAFANNMEPNRPNLANWPKYGINRTQLQIGPISNGSVTQLTTDSYRMAGIKYLGSAEWRDTVFL